MKKALMIVTVLFIAVISTACINNMAVQELNNKAAEYMQKGDYEAAMSRLQASLDLDATMFETYYNLGIASINAGKNEKAIEALENGIKLNPDFVDFYYSLGLAQSNFAEEILGENDNINSDEENNKKEISEEDKSKVAELRASAIDNLNLYLDKKPNCEEKSEIEALILQLNGGKPEKAAE